MEDLITLLFFFLLASTSSFSDRRAPKMEGVIYNTVAYSEQIILLFMSAV